MRGARATISPASPARRRGDGAARARSSSRPAGSRPRSRSSPFGIAWRRDGEEQALPAGPHDAGLSRCRRAPARSRISWRATMPSGITASATRPARSTAPGRRFAIDAVDPCGFDAELSDPLYKMLPFFIVDGPAGRAWRLLRQPLDRQRRSRLHARQLSRPVPLLERRRWRSRLLRAWPARPCPTWCRRFSWLTGGQAFAPRWSFGFGVHLDGDRRCARCRCPHQRLHRQAAATHASPATASISARATPRSAIAATSSTGTATSSRTRARRWRGSTMPASATGHQPQALPARRPSAPAGGAGQGLPRQGRRDRLSRPSPSSGTGSASISTSPTPMAAPGGGRHRDGAARPRRRLGVERQQRIRDLGRGRRLRRRRPALSGRRSRAPAQPLLMTKLSFETQAERAPGKRPYAITRGGPAPASRATARPGPATTRRPGRRCATT